MYCKGACSGNIGHDLPPGAQASVVGSSFLERVGNPPALPPGAQAAVVGSSFLERVGNPPARRVGSPRGFCAQVSFQRPGSAGPCAHSPGRADGCPSLALLRKIGEGRPTSWLNFKLHWELGLCCAAMSGGTVRSLGKGSAPPGPVPEGLIRVYSMRFCPYAKRTLLVLRAKGIRHEVININLKNKPEWFFKKNPLGLVPVLETSLGQLICESAITCEYLDEAYPGKKLLPGDPYEKACQKMVLESFSKVPSLMVSFLRKQNKEDCSGLKEELHKEFSKLEEVLTNKKTTFFGGNSLSMIDYLIWPWFEWLEALELNEYVEHTPNLKLWMASMKNDPIVSSLPTDVKTLQGFFNLYLQNSPEACDYGL